MDGDRQAVRYNMEHSKKIPVLFNKKENCCGCAACYSICPLNAISMELDEEGFYYPMIKEEKCIRCYQCLEVCPFKEDRA